jgi:hypothetical protein
MFLAVGRHPTRPDYLPAIVDEIHTVDDRGGYGIPTMQKRLYEPRAATLTLCW